MLTQPDSKDEVEGKVTVVSPAADPNTTTVQVWIQVDNPGERLKPGTAVHAAIATESLQGGHGGAGRRDSSRRRGGHGGSHRLLRLDCPQASRQRWACARAIRCRS